MPGDTFRAGALKLKNIDVCQTTIRFVLYMPVKGSDILVADVKIELCSLCDIWLKGKCEIKKMIIAV